jgi:hypothetical protein
MDDRRSQVKQQVEGVANELVQEVWEKQGWQ